MIHFLLALQFLTVIPVKIKDVTKKQIAGSMVYFPAVGLLLGIILAGTGKLLYILGFEYLFINVILVILLIFLTGGIHLDGLADTADAFLSRKNKEGMLEIMRDSHIGVMGVLSLISIILLKISFLSSISTLSKIVSLILMCALSRWSLVLAIFLFPYARQEGKARVFIEGINLKIFSFATVITLVIAVATWGLKGLFVLLLVAICAYLAGKFIKRKINGITGDTLGALCELNELIVLFSIFILQNFIPKICY